MIRTRAKSLLTRFSGILLCGLLALPAFAQTELSIVAFNTWGVPFAAKDRRRDIPDSERLSPSERYERAMKEITALRPDLVVLSEVFTAKGKKRFKNDKVYPYRVDGPGAFPKLISSGLRILSRYPIEGYATLVYKGCKKDDCFSRKGALLAVVRLPSGKRVNVVATHLNARGEDDIRESQILQLHNFVRYYREPDAPVLIAGDFNFDPASGVYSKMLSLLRVEDTWTRLHNASEPGYTSDCETNYYARDYFERYHFPIARERIDYLLTDRLPALESRLILNTGMLYSDHYGLFARYSLESEETRNPVEAPGQDKPKRSKRLETDTRLREESGFDEDRTVLPEEIKALFTEAL